jgi:hypothetical protein
LQPKVATKPAKHATVPKVTKKTAHKAAVQKPAAAPKPHHHHHHHHHHHKQTKKTAKTVVHDKQPVAKKVPTVKEVHDKTVKKAKNPVKALVMKHNKTAKTAKKVVHDKKPAPKKVQKVKNDKPVKAANKSSKQ